ncbi:adenine phosphoribosyltransferase [Tolypothrix sp. NIES-4075]|uniref:adenine phosphoribosyltransferase n=1 Tax=Tolypothrix sp. NIES-4075 TaxID=2005459 RepID=UPI000B5CF9CC|nr:adenine phosphoribosyltransferase [Tolypothrix sp. NIES-4075]GAX45434.1 adenine phosphoribosyltransferase [Tolypothrix sp. NIES-4075]
MQTEKVVSQPELSPRLIRLFDEYLSEIPDFPIKGILFKDIAPVLGRKGVLTDVISTLEPFITPLDVDVILAVDARGFILGGALAASLHTGFVMVRKPGKLPGKVQSFEYTCEYSSGTLEVSEGVIEKSARCLIVDDLLATGGTARATADFVYSLGANVVGYSFLVEIEALKGRDRLTDSPVFTLFRS